MWWLTISPLLMKYGRLSPSFCSQSSQKQRKMVSIAIWNQMNCTVSKDYYWAMMVTDCSLNSSQHCYWDFSLHHLQTHRDPTIPTTSSGSLLAASSAKIWNMWRYVCVPSIYCQGLEYVNVCLYFSLHLLPRFRVCEYMYLCSLNLVLRFRICKGVPACFPHVFTAV